MIEISMFKCSVTRYQHPFLISLCGPFYVLLCSEASTPCRRVRDCCQIPFWEPQSSHSCMMSRSLGRETPIVASVVQEFVNPHGFTGKGWQGKGRGRGFKTLTKPLPTTRVWGYPRFFGWVSISLSPASLSFHTSVIISLWHWHARWCASVCGPSWTLYKIWTSKQRQFFRTS